MCGERGCPRAWTRPSWHRSTNCWSRLRSATSSRGSTRSGPVLRSASPFQPGSIAADRRLPLDLIDLLLGLAANFSPLGLRVAGARTLEPRPDTWITTANLFVLALFGGVRRSSRHGSAGCQGYRANTGKYSVNHSFSKGLRAIQRVRLIP